ncbi:MAG: ABC transporter permease [Myxococcota bacterium]|nr:ABC transporter permease [Myxococcota bacterium]
MSPRSLAGLGRALATHLGGFVLAILGAALLLQLLLSLAPGDAADLVAGDPDLRAALVQSWGLDRPVWSRTLTWLSAMLGGDWGMSLTTRPGTPVAELVARSSACSAPVLAGSLMLSLSLSVLLSWKRWTLVSRGLSLTSVLPVFLLAAAAIVGANEVTFAGIQAGRWSAPAWFALPVVDHPLRTALAVLCLGLGSSAFSEMHQESVEALERLRRAPFVLAARARGASLTPILLRNLALPLSGLVARRAAFFVGGLVVIEKVLQIQGAGALLWQACRQRDWPLVVGLSLVAAVVVAGTRLAADLFRLALDPRLRAAQ